MHVFEAPTGLSMCENGHVFGWVGVQHGKVENLWPKSLDHRSKWSRGFLQALYPSGNSYFRLGTPSRGYGNAWCRWYMWCSLLRPNHSSPLTTQKDWLLRQESPFRNLTIWTLFIFSVAALISLTWLSATWNTWNLNQWEKCNQEIVLTNKRKISSHRALELVWKWKTTYSCQQYQLTKLTPDWFFQNPKFCNVARWVSQ